VILGWLPLIGLVLAAQAQPAGRCQPATVVDCPEAFYAAPGAASRQDKEEVSRAIQRALDAQTRRAALDLERSNLALYIKKPSLDPDKRRPDELAAALVKAGRSRKAAEDDEYRLFNAAVALAVPAYNLTPPRTAFPDAPRGAEVVPWKPRFSKLEKFDETTRRWRARSKEEIEVEASQADGKAVAMGVSAAQTWSDGRISLHWLAFVRNGGTRANPVYVPDPDFLASIIAHETVHWVREHRRKESTSRMGIFEAYAGESAGNAAQADLLRKQGHPAAAEFSKNADQYLEQARQMTGAPDDVTWEEVASLHPDWLPVGGHGRALPPGVPLPPEPGAIDGLEWAREQSGRSFRESLGSFADLAAEARRAADAHEAGRQAQSERERQSRRDRMAQEDARKSAAWDYLAATAKLACTDPDALEEQVRLNKAVAADVDSLYLMARLAKTQASGWDNVGKGLSACEQTLVNDLLRSRRPVAVYDLLGWARDYRAANPTLGESIARALAEFSDALGRVPAPTGAAPGSESPPSESRDDVPERTSPPRERDAQPDGERGGIYVPPCMQVGGSGRCIRWR
jgi:hypothetical protein